MTCIQRLGVVAVSILPLLVTSTTEAVRALEPLQFRAVVINAESEFSAAAAIDVNKDGRLDIVSGGWWYAAPDWKKTKLRDVEKIGTRFDDYSNLPMDVDRDGDLDLVSVNYRSKSIYWVRNPGSADQLWERVAIDAPGASETGRLEDLDGDGALDILPNGTTFAAWYSQSPVDGVAINKGGDAKWYKHSLPEELAGHGLGVGDINKDGRTDIVCANGWAEAPVNRRSDRWIWHPDFRFARDCSIPMIVMDVDSDGDNDLIWGRGHNVGIYWTEQRQAATKDSSSTTFANSRVPSTTQDFLLGKTVWVTHAIDTSWSCAHAPMLADLDGDGITELIAGKRYQGHEGRDPGENEPLNIFSYQFNKERHAWQQRTISHHPLAGLDLDPKTVDIDGDGDLDIICPARSGLVLLENLRKSSGTSRSEVGALASELPKLPTDVLHADFSKLSEVAADGTTRQRPLLTPLDLGQRREQIQRQMAQVMGPLPTSIKRVPLDIEIQTVEAVEKYTRIKLTYVSEPGDRVPAYLLIPHEISEPAPAALCLHPTQFELGKAQLLGLGGKVSRFYAHELAELGFVCLAPDYPGFAEYKYEFAGPEYDYQSGTMKAIWNNIRAVDLLECLPCVRRDSIGCIGHSLGGHNSLYTAAFDVRLRAVVTSCGFNAFEDYYGGDLKGWSSDRYMPLIATRYNKDPRLMPFDFPEVLTAIAPRAVYVNAPLRDANFAVQGVRKCQDAVEPVYKLLDRSEALKFEYPDAEHDFPDQQRQNAYQFLKQHLTK